MNEDLDRFLSRRFSTLDNDGDGYLESWDSIDAICQLGHEFGHKSESPQWNRLADLTEAWWEHLVRVSDVNADGRISEEEYKTAFSKGLLETPESFDAVYKPFLSAIMDIIDEDHDGRITVTDEIRYAGSLMRIPEAEAREIFRRLDQDGDGFATKEELLEAIRAAYFDDSAESPRHWVLGPLDQPIDLLNNNSGGGTVIPARGVPEIEFHRRGWWGFELHCNDAALEYIERMRDKLFSRIGRFLPLKVRAAIHVWIRIRKRWLKAIMRTTGGAFGVRLLSPWPIPVLLTPLPLLPGDWRSPNPNPDADDKDRPPPPLPPPPPRQDTGLRWSMGDLSRAPADEWSEAAMFPEGHGTRVAPALAEFRGRLYCTFPSSSSQIQWTVYDPDSGWKEEEEFVSSNLFSATSPGMAVFGDRLYCFVRSVHTDRLPISTGIGYSVFDGNTWSDPASFIPLDNVRVPDAGVPSGTSTVVFRGELYVFFRGGAASDGPMGLWYVRMAGNHQWTRPVRVRDIISITGCAVAVHRDRLVCIYAAEDTFLMLTWFDGTNWSVPHRVPVSPSAETREEPAITSMEGQLYVIFRSVWGSSLVRLRTVGTDSPPPVNSQTQWPQMELFPNFLHHESNAGVGLAVYTDPHMVEDCPDFDAANRPRPQLMAVFRGTHL